MADNTFNYATMRRCVRYYFTEYIRENREIVYEMFKDFKEGEKIDKTTMKFLRKIVLLCMDKSPVYCPTYRSEWKVTEFLNMIREVVNDENVRIKNAKIFHEELRNKK